MVNNCKSITSQVLKGDNYEIHFNTLVDTTPGTICSWQLFEHFSENISQ